MNARRWDVGLGLGFAALGVLLAIAGWRLPPGLSGVPGPGVFPMLIGTGLLALGIGLAAFSNPGRATYWEQGWTATTTRQVVIILALLALYAALWNMVPFIWRTPVLLAGIYRVVGEPWPRSLMIAVVTTAVLAGVFDGLLRVRL
jgi:putative tricarboxylic transport membrane protein